MRPRPQAEAAGTLPAIDSTKIGDLTMSKSFFDAFGELARTNVSTTQMAGRYEIQASAERRIVDDVKTKLALGASDRLLEIGCGPGNLLIPLAFATAEAVGIDHPHVIAQARRIFSDPRVKWLEGQFPDVKISGLFDCILAYSVIQYLRSFDDVLAFIEAGTMLLKDGGRFLIADIPNKDKKRRFGESEVGRAFETEWRKSVDENSATSENIFDDAVGIGPLDDAGTLEIAARFRARDFHVYILPQSPELPFGYTREDLLIVRP
jgi:cyclopropane fatty-acyl-phospholipid synthase-like methyltransferase